MTYIITGHIDGALQSPCIVDDREEITSTLEHLSNTFTDHDDILEVHAYDGHLIGKIFTITGHDIEGAGSTMHTVADLVAAGMPAEYL